MTNYKIEIEKKAVTIFGENDIALTMTLSLKGNNQESLDSTYIFEDSFFRGPFDRLNVPNPKISGYDTSNVTLISSEQKLDGVQVFFATGFEDLPLSQLQIIFGNPATAFSTYPENLANIIRKICTGV